MDPEDYRKKIERDILNIIEEKLINGQMDARRAKAIAKMVLEKLHPPLTLEQIFQIVPTLDDHFTELSQAVLPVMEAHDELIRRIVSDHATKLIKSGNIYQAQAVMKEALQRQKR